MNCPVCDPKKKYPYCICHKDWKVFDKILHIIKEINNPLVEKNFDLSTITVCSDFNSTIDLRTLSQKFEKNNVKFNPNSKKCKVAKNNFCFYNSVIVNFNAKYQHFGYVSIKIFPNGKIQIAGCKTIMSCAYSIRKIYNKIKNYECFLDDSKITNSRIAMINSDIKINMEINQENLCEILENYSIHNSGSFIQINFQNSKYPAINSKFISKNRVEEYRNYLQSKSKNKFENVISILIFRSGSIILTGGKDIKDYYEAYTKLLKILNVNKKEVLKIMKY